MSGTPPTPAAQYLRVSTEDQQYSIANQQAAIQTYAEENGYDIVSAVQANMSMSFYAR